MIGVLVMLRRLKRWRGKLDNAMRKFFIMLDSVVLYDQ